MKHPAFNGFGEQLLPWADNARYYDTRLERVGSLMPYHSHVDADVVVGALNGLIDEADAGKTIFYEFYTERQKQEDPDKRLTGLFFHRGKPGAPFAIVCPGGGFSYVGSLHEGFPLAREISRKGLNAFVIRYRVDERGATEDLAAAVSYVFRNSERLGVDTRGYSLWGCSAGARMVGNIALRGVAGYGGDDLPRPATAVIAYTGQASVSGDFPPTFINVSEDDRIVDAATVERRVRDLKAAGVEVEFHKYKNVGHGFGLGVGTEAEGWIGQAIDFWKAHIPNKEKRSHDEDHAATRATRARTRKTALDSQLSSRLPSEKPMRPTAIIAVLCLTSAQAQESNVGKPQEPAPGATKADAPASAAPTARTTSGVVRGVTEGDVSIFKGTPYAAAPVGPNRWRPPQPAPTWEGERDASQFGSNCAQAGFGRGGSGGIAPNSSEDCLFINIWRPATAGPDTKLPVMVWIHGGAFVFGRGSGSSGVEYAKQGVMLVTFNYRLGRLGFFAFPALSLEHSDEPKGNYGYMDQIAALKWVQQNIAAFGGDPNNVTIVGESAGGVSVHTLLSSPLARGLFHRAISQSGGGRDGVLISAESYRLRDAKRRRQAGGGPSPLEAIPQPIDAKPSGK